MAGAAEVGTVHRADRLRGAIVVHLDEREATWAACVSIGDDRNLDDRDRGDADLHAYRSDLCDGRCKSVLPLRSCVGGCLDERGQLYCE